VQITGGIVTDNDFPYYIPALNAWSPVSRILSTNA